MNTTFLRHPLVVVVVAAAIAIGFYYYASPYEQCMRFHEARYTGDADRKEFAAVIFRQECSSETNW